MGWGSGGGEEDGRVLEGQEGVGRGGGGEEDGRERPKSRLHDSETAGNGAGVGHQEFQVGSVSATLAREGGGGGGGGRVEGGGGGWIGGWRVGG